jgi:outer membrane biosynthesis protein TonB
MAKNPPSRGYSESFRERAGAASGRFWRNVVLIALAHVALIAGLIRWSLAARASSNSESIVWLGAAEDLAAGKSENEPSPSATPAPPPVEPKPAKDNEAQEEKPVVPIAKSEIELPSPIPKPTATATPTPKPAANPIPKPKATPKPIPKPIPKKTLVAKASPKPSAKAKPSPAKSSEKSEKKEKNALAKTESASQSGNGKTGSARKGGGAGGGSSAWKFGWYGHMLHDRFYSAWMQPTTNVASSTKISTLVKVRIEKDGRVSKFEIVKPSENVIVDESVAAIGKRVTEVDAPPAGLATGDHYDVKINFELSANGGTESR